MKIFAFAFAILLAGVSAVPSLHQAASDLEVRANERFVDSIVASAIEDLSQDIRDLGLDPLYIDGVREEYRLPVTNLVIVDVVVDKLVSTGLSNIIIENINYGILTSRLRMTLVIPKIFFGVESAHVNALLMGWEFNAGVSGSLAILEPRVAVDVRIQLGIISGVSIRSISVDFTLGGVESNLNLNILGQDLSEDVNHFAEVTVPTTLADNRAEINELLEYIILQLAEN